MNSHQQLSRLCAESYQRNDFEESNIEVIFEEPGFGDECAEDPYLMTDPNTILNYLKEGLIPAAEKLQQE